MMDCGTASVLAFGAALAILGAERRSLAQNTPNAIPAVNSNGFDTHLFRPAMDSKGLFTVNGSDVLGARDFSFGLVLDYGHVLLRTPDRQASSSITRFRERFRSTTASPTSSSSASTCRST